MRTSAARIAAIRPSSLRMSSEFGIVDLRFSREVDDFKRVPELPWSSEGRLTG